MTEGVVGVLLAGGKSSRMGGGDKCLLPLAGKPMLAHVIARLSQQVSELILNANGDPSRFSAFGLPVVADRVSGYSGPLAGIHSGLEWAIANRPASRYVITAATDTPFFPADLVARFRAHLEDEEPKLLVACSQEGIHPVFGLWPVALAPAIEQSLAGGMRKVQSWVREHQAEEIFYPAIEAGGRKIDPFFNLNRPEEFAEADALLGGGK
jgi:molybdopterin-guanine dinucleotide biosynthesis protein A